MWRLVPPLDRWVSGKKIAVVSFLFCLWLVVVRVDVCNDGWECLACCWLAGCFGLVVVQNDGWLLKGLLWAAGWEFLAE